MRPTDITRLRRADVLVIPGGRGAAASMHGVSGRRGAAIVLLLSAVVLNARVRGK
jgi:hypothetical protein